MNPTKAAKLCIFESCSNKARSRNLCGKHYQQVKRKGQLEDWPLVDQRIWVDEQGIQLLCSFNPCLNLAASKGWCPTHYQMNRLGKPLTEVGRMIPCPTPGCLKEMAPSGTICRVCNQFRWRYSLTSDQVILMNSPESRICGNNFCDQPDPSLHLDHDHSCCPPGKFKTSSKVSCGDCVRGWLCRQCNFALGLVNENPRRIGGLADYLSEFKR